MSAIDYCDTNLTYFDKDTKLGDVGIKYYIDEYLIPKGYTQNDYRDVSRKNLTFDMYVRKTNPRDEEWKVEIKKNLPFNNSIIMEDYTNCNTLLGPERKGWALKTECDWMVSINTQNGDMVFVDMRVVKPFYLQAINEDAFIKKYPLRKNKITQFSNGGRAQGAIRIIRYEDFPERSLWLYNRKTNPELTLIK